MRSCNPTLPSALSGHHLDQLGPVVVGEPCWRQLDDSALRQRQAGVLFSSWSLFQQAVNREFGFTKEQEQAAFYTMRKGADETATDFVLRIEAKRK